VLGSEDAFIGRQAQVLFERAEGTESTTATAGTVLTSDARFLVSLGMTEEGDGAATEEDWGDAGRAGEVRLDVGALFSADPVLVRRVIREACKRVLPAQERITYKHITTIAEQGNRVGFVTVIPGAVTVVNEYGTLVFRAYTPVSDPFCNTWELELREGVPAVLPDGRAIGLFRVEPEEFAGDPVRYARTQATPSQVFIDGEALENAGGTLVVKQLEVGDRFCPLGMNGQHKLVSDVLIDRKVIRRERAGLFKVCAVSGEQDREDEIVWIIAVGSDDRYKVSAETTAMFSIIVSGSENR
jgi:tRNA(Ile)-lysidine synthase